MEPSSSKGSSENEKKRVVPTLIGELKKDEGSRIDKNTKSFQKILDSFKENTKNTLKADIREKVISKAWKLFANCEDSFKKSTRFERVLRNTQALETHDHLRIIFTELKSHKKSSKDNRCYETSSSFVKQTDPAEKNKKQKEEENEVVSDTNSSEKLKVTETSKPSTSSSSPKENENEHRQSWGIDYNSNLFEKFLDCCKEKLMGQSSAVECEKIIVKAWSLFNNCKTSYKGSAVFEELIRQAMNSLSIDPRSQLKSVLDELKYNKKVGCQSLKSALDKPSTSSTVVDPNASETNQEPKDDDLSDTDSLSGVEPEKRKKVKMLEKTLRLLNLKIIHLEEREVDLDDDDSAYVKLDRYRERFVKVYTKICELKKKSADAGRPIKRNVSFAGTGYADVERAVEKYYNKTKSFPDFHDILKLTTEIKKDEKLTPFKINDIAREVFEQFGKMLKRRRQMDYYDSVSSYLSIHPTHPADEDEETHKKLDENSELFKRKLSEVLDTFTKRAEGIEPEEVKSDAGSNASSDTSDDEQSSKRRDEEIDNISHCSEDLEENNILNAVGLQVDVSKNQVNDEPSGSGMRGDSVENLDVKDSNIQTKSSECNFESELSKFDEDKNKDDSQEDLKITFIEKVLESVMKSKKEESFAGESELKEISKDEKTSSSRRDREINSQNDKEGTSSVVNKGSKNELKKSSDSVNCKSGSDQSVEEKTSKEYHSKHSKEEKFKHSTQTENEGKKISKDTSKISTQSEISRKSNEENNSKHSKEEKSKSSTQTENESKKISKDTSKISTHSGISRKGSEENNSKHSKEDKSKSSTQTGNEIRKLSKDTSKMSTHSEISRKSNEENNSKHSKEEKSKSSTQTGNERKKISQDTISRKGKEENNSKHSKEDKSKSSTQTGNEIRKLSKDTSKMSTHSEISRKSNEENNSKHSKEEKSKSSTQTENERKKISKDTISRKGKEENNSKHSKEDKSKSSTQTGNEIRKLSKDTSKIGTHSGISKESDGNTAVTGAKKRTLSREKETEDSSAKLLKRSQPQNMPTPSNDEKLSNDDIEIIEIVNDNVQFTSNQRSSINKVNKDEKPSSKTLLKPGFTRTVKPMVSLSLNSDCEVILDETNKTRTIDTGTSNIKSVNSSSVNSTGATANFINNNNMDLPMISAAFSLPADDTLAMVKDNINSLVHKLAPSKLQPSQTSSQTTKSSSDCSIVFEKNCVPEKRTNSPSQPMKQSASSQLSSSVHPNKIARSTSKQSVSSLQTKHDDADVSVITIDDETGNQSSNFRTSIEGSRSFTALGGPKFTSTPYKVDRSQPEQPATIHSQRPQSTRLMVNGKTKLISDSSARQVLSSGKCKLFKKIKLDPCAKKIDNTVITLD